jgi:hypothetical protein
MTTRMPISKRSPRGSLEVATGSMLSAFLLWIVG